MVNLLHLTHTNLAANPKNGIFQIRKWVSEICRRFKLLGLLQHSANQPRLQIATRRESQIGFDADAGTNTISFFRPKWSKYPKLPQNEDGVT